ncbi:DinB family protein [Halobacillus naozhouensis]|uniref:DinB family protein n=1 Tax=Halobacillus naozhouensis TaxID=554880 RepID=A0ABY8IZ68_9BACI|nr:DinB family protein [Halobacillus naozhouensis]WFT75121.1 DinB family protein [Halobacillus naozhouensis]
MNHVLMKQFEFHVWAYEKTFRHLESLPDHVFEKKMQNVFPSLAKVFGHVYVVDNLWLGAIAGKSFHEVRRSIGQWTEETEGRSIVGMEELFGHLAHQYRNFLHDKHEGEVIKVVHPEFGNLTASYFDLIQHVVKSWYISSGKYYVHVAPVRL